MSPIAQDRFARLAALRPARKSGISLDDRPRGTVPEIPEGAGRLAELLGAAPQTNRFGEHLALRRWFSDPIGGEPNLCAPDDKLDAAALRLLAPGAADCVSDPREWLFLDTETTGLAGGTGTYPFLIGIAWWDAGGLEVEQFFMREQSEEHSLLVALAERMAERRVLVTFNGKSFDWPLLETRYRMTRTINAPVPRAHLDFLHPARNLWRLRIGSVRLAELERQILGWNRGTDVMSEMIPSIYFDYLRGGPAEPLIPIFHHNQMDLRGLAALATRVLSLLGDPETHGQDALELFGVSRICERRGEAARARSLYQRSIASTLPPETDRAARRSLARLAKREGDHELARELWNGMLGNSREGLEAYEQLAIHYEHRAREPHRAAALAREALVDLRKANRLGTIAPSAYKQQRMRFERRLARLERKSNRTLLDAPESKTDAMH
ncbi:MAG TPA: ribonuclease H-like domain-containing protein [Candidatus Acidoferrales bacterium]|nr:ribonuclease H-like domain-containing protein [Candidatus Acidoferrales bacterium]